MTKSPPLTLGERGAYAHSVDRGGNVRNSVSKTILTLSPEGYLQVTSPRPWFLIIENRLN